MTDLSDKPKVEDEPKQSELDAVQQRFHAVVFSKSSEAGDPDELDQGADNFVKYLTEEYKLDVPATLQDSGDLSSITRKLSEVARKCDALRCPGTIVALVVRESDKEADLDAFVNSIKGKNDKHEKLIIFCRICDQDTADKAECLKPLEAADGRTRIRNAVIIRFVAKTRDLAARFIDTMRRLMIQCQCASNGLSELTTSKHLSLSQITGVEFMDGLVPNLLKDQECVRKIVEDELRLKHVNSECVQSQTEDFNKDIRDVVYQNSQRSGKPKALIINIKDFDALELSERVGSEADCQNLEFTLKLLQYTVDIKRKLKANEIRKAVETFANDPEHGDSCILVVMSHGCAGVICGSDYERNTKNGVVNKSELLELIGKGGSDKGTVEKSDLLKLINKDGGDKGIVKESELLDLMQKGSGVKTKPRLVLFQTCRSLEDEKSIGESGDAKPVQLTAAQEAAIMYYGYLPAFPINVPLPDQCGMIVGHSTSLGDSAFRSVLHNGSRFILAVCITFLRLAHIDDVAGMIPMVNNIMTHGFEAPTIMTEEKSGKPRKTQLPWWSVQTDKKFFLVDTTSLFDSWDQRQGGETASQRQPGGALPKPTDLPGKQSTEAAI